jgi:predicted transcriptional regulator
MQLRRYLDNADLTPPAFAEIIGVPPQTVYRYLSGARLPRRDVMCRIVAATNGRVLPGDFYPEAEACGRC